MSRELYACIRAAEFPAQSLLRLRQELRREPVAVLDGKAPQESVCSMNSRAMQSGAEPEMTRVEAEAIPGLHLFHRSAEGEMAARSVVFECAANFSPRIEDISSGTVCACVLDIAGTEQLFGPPGKLGERIRSSLLSVGIRCSIAISANYHTARMKAAHVRGVAVIPAGEEARALEALPLDALTLTENDAETFTLWGTRTLGELAAMPELELISRFGQRAKTWTELARGEHAHTFQPIEPEFVLKEFCEFDEPVEQIESLLFVGSRMIDALVSRTTMRAMSLASLAIAMKLEGGSTHSCAVRPALPTIDRKFLLKLLQLEIAAHPPSAAVLAVTLAAEAGQSSKAQLGLFAPPTPEPSRLDVTIARLKALVGEDRVGSPVLEDTHKPGSFHMEGFVLERKSERRTAEQTPMCLRRLRPPIAVRVSIPSSLNQTSVAPTAFRGADRYYTVAAAYGPWQSNGNWWSKDAWDVEEWDVLAEDSQGTSVACLLVRERRRNVWRLEAFYD